MFTDKQRKAFYSVIIFTLVCFSRIRKNLDFIQGILTFTSISLVIVTTVFAIFCNSNIPSESQNNPQHKCGNTTGWKRLTCELQKYMHSLLKLIILALVVLIFPSSYKETVSLPVISKYAEHKFSFSLDTVLWYLDIALWYSNIILWYFFYSVYSYLCCVHAV